MPAMVGLKGHVWKHVLDHRKSNCMGSLPNSGLKDVASIKQPVRKGWGEKHPIIIHPHPSSPAELRLHIRKTHPEVRVREPLDVVHIGQSSDAQKRREKGLDFQRWWYKLEVFCYGLVPDFQATCKRLSLRKNTSWIVTELIGWLPY